MKTKIIIVFLINFLYAQILQIEDLSVSDQNLFEKFKQQYHKKYQNESELKYRFEIFQKNLRILKKEPDFEDSSGMILLGASIEPPKPYTMGLNQFADMTDEEFQSQYLIPTNLLYRILPADGIAPIFNVLFQKDKKQQEEQDKGLLKNIFGGFSKIFGRRLQNAQALNNIKRQIDWESLGKVSPVKNQKRCNSCYAFAATGALESMFSIKYESDFIALSTQEILDCDTVNKGCKGGQPSLVFDYVSKNGLSLEKDYEYVAKDETCKLNGRRLQFYYGGQNNYQPYNQQTYGGYNNNSYNYNNGYGYQQNQYQNNYTQPQQYNWMNQDNNYQYNTQNQYQQNNVHNGLNNINTNQNYNQGHNNWNTNHTQNNVQNNNIQNNWNTNHTQNNIQNNNTNQNNNIIQNNSTSQNNTTQNNNQNTEKKDIKTQKINELKEQHTIELEDLKNQYEIQRKVDRDLINEEQKQILNLIDSKNIAIEEKVQQIQNIKQKKQNKQLLDFVADELLNFDEEFIKETKQQIQKLQKEIDYLKKHLIEKIEQTEQEQIKLYEDNKQQMLEKHEKELQDLQKEIKEQIEKEKDEQKQEQNITKSPPKFTRFNFLRTYKTIPQNIISLLQALQDGPVVVAHHVSSQLKFYAKGVFSGDGCENKPVNHASLIIGYNLDDEVPFFRLKNAWGTKWGEEGYYKIAIGDIGYDKQGICSIAGTPFNVQPVLKQLISNLQMEKYFKKVQLQLTEEESKDPEFKKILLKTWKEKIQAQSDRFEKLQKPSLKDYSANHILLMGLPKTEESKASKVEQIIVKKVIPSLKLTDAFLSIKLEIQNQKTTGIAILRFKNQELANTAANSLDRFILTKSLTLRAITFENFNKVFETTQNLRKDQFKTYDELINWWDQEQIKNNFIVYGSDPNEIQYITFNPLTKNIVNISKEQFKGRRVTQIGYNQSGNYLMVFFEDILEIYSNKNMQYITAFFHPKIKSAKFSNNEKYLITYNGTVNDTKDTENIIVWDFYLGNKIRIFKLQDIEQQSSFDFSYDSQYFSGFQYQDNQQFLYVYELPNMNVIEDPVSHKKSQLNIKNPWKCSWSPASNVLAVSSYYNASMDSNTKTELLIYEIPTRKTLPWTIFQFKIKDIDFYWSQNANYLLVNFLSKIKKTTQNIVQLGVYDNKSRRFYVSTIQNEKNEKQVNFVVSPNGKNFIEVLKTDSNKKKQVLKFYSIENQKAKQIYDLQTESKFQFKFCPNSKYLLMSQKNKNVYFSEYQYSQGKVQFKMYKMIEMPMYELALWSPCGRYIAFQKKARGGLQVIIRNSVGEKLYETTFDKKQIYVWQNYELQQKYKVDKNKKTEIKEYVKNNYGICQDKDQEKIDNQKYQQKKKVEENQKEFQNYFQKKMKLWNEDYKQIRISSLGYDEDQLSELEDIMTIDKRELIDEIAVANF